VEVSGSTPAPQAPGGQPSGAQPAAPGQPQPATGQPSGGQPVPGQPVSGQPSGGQPAHGGRVPPALPSAPGLPSAPQPGQQPYGQGYYGAPTPTHPPTPTPGPPQGQRGFPPPPPESGSRRPWPAPDGAPAPPSYPLPPGSDNQWLWGDSGASDNGASGNSAPGNGSGQSGTHPTVILQSSQPGAPAGPPPTTVQPTTVQPGAVPPTTIQPTTVQPGALPPTALPPGSDPYGPPATTVQPSRQGFAAGAPQPWPQGPNGSAGQYGPPGPGGPQGPHDSTSTMPSMAPFGPGDQDQWGPAMGGWPQAGPGPGHASGLSGIGSRLSGLRAKRPHGPVIPAIGVAAAIVVIAAIVVAVRGGGSNQAANNTPAPGATASAPAQQSNTAQKQAAAQLAGLLSQSGGDRGSVNHAYFAVQACRTLPRDRQVFARAAANRRNLLNKLGSLHDSSALNPAMIQALTGAWQASAQADTDYANWAASLEHGCKRGKTAGNPNLKASLGPDGTATADKKAFVQEWNPLAQKYGLKTYTFGEL
jgi:hypothetical protein